MLLVFFVRFSRHWLYWAGLMSFAVAMLGVGSYYQHILAYWPCLACIHVRIWVIALFFVALFGLLGRGSRVAVNLAQLGVVIVGAGLLERAWFLLGTERGFITEGCDVNLDLPGALPLDKWWPWMFEVWTSCDYTPRLLLGMTMAEALVVLSALLMLLGAVLALIGWLSQNR